MKKIILVSVLSITLTLSPATFKAKATGFPTIDLASIVQGVTDYGQQVAQYGEMIQQGVLKAQEVVQAINTYQQMLVEYTIMLNNLQDVASALESGDLIDAFSIVMESDLSEYVSADFEAMATDLIDIWVEVDELRSFKFGGIDDVEEFLLRIEDLYAEDPELLEAAQMAVNMQVADVNVAAASKAFIKEIDKLDERLDDQDELIDDLGPESENATLQYIAKQLISQQKLDLIKYKYDANQKITGVSFDEMVNRKRTESINASAERREAALNATIEYPTD